ncbi:hypothetical protein [Clostridioides difficile]|uniref:hypothetical protein n=1 Tax=Clostridioides difficile TaxID=1496 RepID=UPI001F3CDDF1|nr:hypothetical protein [Clostridioides difficile]
MKTPRNINSTVVFIIFCLIITFLLSVILTTITSFNEYNVLSKALVHHMSTILSLQKVY